MMTLACTPRRQQKGLVLVVALIMLVVMSMMGIAMYRQVGMGFAIAGNLAFKQSALAASDRGIERARDWLTNTIPATTLPQTFTSTENPTPTLAYFAAWCHTTTSGTAGTDGSGNTDCGAGGVAPFDPLTYDWSRSGIATADDGAGNEVRFVIHRLCEIDGDLNAVDQQCVTKESESGGGKQIGEDFLTQTRQAYYRITTRTVGPRNTTVYSQMIMY